MDNPHSRNPESTLKIGGHPLHPLLVTLPIGFFVATLLFDLIYWQTGDAAFAKGALWLLGIGLLGGALAALAGVIDFMGDERIRAFSEAWQHAIGNVIVVLLQCYSFYHRYAAGVEAGASVGLWLSIISVLILLFTGWQGGELVFRRRVAVRDDRP